MAVDDWDAYERISDDPTDERVGVGRQHDDNEEAVRSRGGRVQIHHTENDTSAYTGQAKRLMVWDLDRLARDPRDLEDAIEVVMHYGAEIRSASATDIDLSTETGRMNARLMVMIANKSSADTSRRVKRQKQERLAQGMPPGSRYRTFGYTREWKVVESEAAVVRETFDRLARGESVNSISRDLRGRGIVTVTGRPISFAATARILDSPIYAGLLSYKGEIVGKSVVPALVSEAAFAAASQRATKPAWNTRKHLLSGIAICDLCKTPMNFSSGAYVCARIIGGCGKVRIKAAWLDDAVQHGVRFLAMWKRSQGVPVLETASTTEVDPVHVLDKKIEDAQRAHTSGDLDLADLLPMLKDLRAQRSKIVAAQGVEVEGDKTWAAMDDYDIADLSMKRTLVKRHVLAVPVAPTSKRGNSKFDASRFTIVTAYKDEAGSDMVLAGEACDLLGSLWGARGFGMERPGEFPTLADDVIDAVWSAVNRS